MSKMTFVRKTFCVTAMTFALISAADASAARTFVSGLGSDSNTASNCPRATPCRTLAAAHTVTSSGGEIIALDPAGYGSITITGPVSLLGVEGAAIAVPTGGTGVVISSGAVSIINFVISGAGASSSTGIALNSGSLVLRNSILKGLTTGLNMTGHADIINTDFVGNTTAIITNGTGGTYNGFAFNPSPAPTAARINGGNFVNNTTAFTENNPSSANGFANATIWVFTPGTSLSANVTGYTTLMTVTGTGAGNSIPGMQNYSGGSAPN